MPASWVVSPHLPVGARQATPRLGRGGARTHRGTGHDRLSDRFDNRWLLFWYYGLRGLSLIFLPYAYGTGFFGLALFVVFYGLDWVATVPPTVRLAADLFGKQNVGRVFAWIFVAHQLGAAGIAYTAGALRLWLGDYQAAFMFSGLICLVAAGMAIRIGRSTASDAVPIQPPDTAASAAGD